MLSKVFMAGDAPQGSFNNGLAILRSKMEDDQPGMFLIWIYKGETLQWPFRVTSSRAVSLPIVYHDGMSYSDGWQPYHSKCFCSLLIVPESGDVILPNELTSLPHYMQVVFKVEREYGPCCMLFKMAQPTGIRVFGSLLAPPRRSSNTLKATPSSLKHPVVSSTPKPSAPSTLNVNRSHSELAKVPTSTVSSVEVVMPVAHSSPGIPVDFVVLQQGKKSTKKRRKEPNTALGHIKDLVVANTKDSGNRRVLPAWEITLDGGICCSWSGIHQSYKGLFRPCCRREHNYCISRYLCKSSWAAFTHCADWSWRFSLKLGATEESSWGGWSKDDWKQQPFLWLTFWWGYHLSPCSLHKHSQPQYGVTSSGTTHTAPSPADCGPYCLIYK